MLVYIGFFIVIAVLAIDYEFNQAFNVYIFGALAFGLALMAGLRNPAIVRDYENYLYAFDMVYTETNALTFALFDPGFIAIVYIFRTISTHNYGVLIMLFYAFASVSLNSISFKKLSVNPYLAMLFYFSQFFMLHEMTQVRIGLASAIFFISISYYLKGNIKAYVGLILLATCFHYTAILYLGLLLLNKESFNRYIYGGILLFAVLLSFINLPLIGYLDVFNSNEFTSKIDSYKYAAEFTYDKVNVLNVITICNILSCLYMIVAAAPGQLVNDQRLTFFLKCNILSIFLLSFLSGVPSIAFRISDLLGILSIFTFPYLVRYLPFKKYNIFITVLIAALFFYYYVLSNDLIKPYRLVEIL